MKPRFWSLPALVALALLALAGTARAGSCEQRTPTMFVLKGLIDADLAKCVATRLAPTTTELVVDSQGGQVGAALDIAERLSTLNDLTIRVDGLCMSSCADFFLPMARRLIAEPRAIIALHGGIDPALVSRSAPDKRFALTALAQRQMDFARRRHIPPGWLLYRTAEAPTRVDGLDGAYRWVTSSEPEVYLVEGPMLRTCLPWLDIGDYQARLEAERFTPDAIARLKRNRVAATGTVVCNGATWP